MAAVVTALLLLSQFHGVANEEKGSTEGPLLPQYKVLLRHSGRDTAEWFNRSSSAALRAAHLAATHINNASSLSITVQLVVRKNTRATSVVNSIMHGHYADTVASVHRKKLQQKRKVTYTML